MTIAIRTVEAKSDVLLISTDSQSFEFKWKDISAKLAKATDAERKMFKVSPSGYGIHWPLIDEDISIQGIINELGA